MNEGLLDFAAGLRERLLADPRGGLLPGETVGDLFCGAGGWTALAGTLGIVPDWCVNHDPVAIATHARNAPGARHLTGDAWRTRPETAAGWVGADGRALPAAQRRPVGVLCASAACTTHSNARGAAPISPRVHMLGWCIARYAKALRPRVLLVENVVEWRQWGPLTIRTDAAGRPVRDRQGRLVRVQDPAKRGTHYRRWCAYMRRLGYVLEERVLEASAFGAASRRKRLFIIARRDGLPIVWPEANGAASGRAADVINWGDLGESIALTRAEARAAGLRIQRPLRPKTVGRIARGILRYVVNEPRPFTLQVTFGEGRGDKTADAGGPLATVTTRQDFGVVVPVVANNTTHHTGSAVTGPMATVTTGGQAALVTPVCVAERRNGEGVAVDGPVGTITAGGLHHGLATPVCVVMRGDQAGASAMAPLATVTAGNGPGRGAGAAHAQAIASPVMVEYYGQGENARRPDHALGAVVTHDRHGVATPTAAMLERGRAVAEILVGHSPPGAFVVNADGLIEVEIQGRRCLLVDVLFRMLRARELAAAMGFPPEFALPTTQRDAVRLVGNAVCPIVGRALLAAALPRGGDGGRRVAGGAA